MSVDPLASDYAAWSTYNYVLGNPVMFVDPDGRKVEPIIEEEGGEDGRDLVTVKLTGKIINFSNNNINMEAALADIKGIIEKAFQGQNINGIDMKLDFSFSIAESMDDVEFDDHLIVLAEPKANNLNVPGAANQYGGKVATIDADYFSGPYDRLFGEEGERTTSHEIGHLFGLGHKNHDKTNLMAQGAAMYRGNNIDDNQLSALQGSLMNSDNPYVAKINKGSNTLYGLPNMGEAREYFKLANTSGRGKSKK